ncbi:uncharacterized protein IL334_006614 [Kwoniella shivajii]|uniref:50S small subunit ribosomal protein L2 n=1 Tax=Kwoniella shivajii TaxID=564305 RepID=A0ABZ1D6F0_9TREE|nr:hypothetical protein IL334_006614 [Kwoniella shivajii]
MTTLSRSVTVARTATATRSSLASTSRLIIARGYVTPSSTKKAEQQMMFGGPPPKRKDEGAVLKTYTGKGYPFIPSLRHVVYPYHPHLHKGGPLRELTIPLRRKGGRNNTGRIVNRHTGGGHKQRLRTIDFHRVQGGAHDVIRIEYDPGRSAHIALIKKRGTGTGTGTTNDLINADQAEDALSEENRGNKKSIQAVKAGWSYIISPEGLRAGDVVVSYRQGIPESVIKEFDNTAPSTSTSTSIDSTNTTEDLANGEDKVGATDTPEMRRALGLLRTVTLKPGNVLPLFLIPPGTQVHNLSLTTDGKMQLCRSAGTFAVIVSHQSAEGRAIGGAEVLTMGGGFDAQGKRLPKAGYVLVKMQSGEVRKLDPGCVASVGVVSNKEHQSRSLGKAGRSRWLGKRPHVRGVAMNAVDHPHGGGRGKQKGNKHPRSIYGLLQHVRTRRPKGKDGNKSVVTERPRGKQTAAKH